MEKDQTIFGIEKTVDKNIDIKKSDAIAEQIANPLTIQQLIVSPLPQRKTILGEVADIVDVTKRKEKDIDAIIWNEEQIQLVFNKGNTQVTFKPEFNPCTAMFFKRTTERWSERHWDDRIWEGEYEPILFQKSKLIQFLKQNSQFFEPEIEDAIKNLKVTESKTEDSEMLSLDDDDNVKTITEEIKTTNIPRNFKATMPLFGGFEIDLNFEACVTKKDEGYSKSKKNYIELKVINAREAIRQVMQMIINQFPEKIPKYYGKTTFGKE